MTRSRHSIRLRLAATAALGVAILGILAVICTYVFLQRRLERQVRAFARHEAEEVAGVVASLSDPGEVRGRLDELERLADEGGVAGLSVWTTAGAPVVRVPASGSEQATSWRGGVGSVAREEGLYQSVHLPGGQPVLRTALPVPEDGEPRWIVVAAVANGQVDEALGAFLFDAAVALPTTVVLTFLGSLLLATRTLRPVQSLVRDAGVIAVEGPSRRLAVPPEGSELRELALLVNKMLDRTGETLSRLRRFTSHAGHELRTPLARIRVEAEAALTGGDPTRATEALVSVLEETEELRRLVDALLDLARGEAPDLLTEPPFSLSDVVEELVEEAGVLGLERDLAVTLGPHAPLAVRGNRVLVARAVWNLLDNAVKFTPPGGSVSVSLRERGDRAHVEVADTGPGCGDDPERLFEPFVKAVEDPSTPGHGLGLALGRAIARRHGGDLTVAPAGGGTGARFRLELLLATDAATDADAVSVPGERAEDPARWQALERRVGGAVRMPGV